MRPLTPEQLLAIADEFCAAHPVHVRSFSALVACAAVPGSRIHGIPVFDTAAPASLALAAAIRRLEPLTALNDAFGTTTADIYRRWVEGA